ncbi:MAG: glycosyltransferase [Planctomycetota bacterium]
MARFSVIVCTYNATRELDLILCSLSRQTRTPDEVIIADDGSGPETRELVESWKPRLDAELLHAWHIDDGFRKTRISNEAARRASGDYLIFLDGDSIPHSRWVEDHETASRPDRVCCGRRVKLGPKISEQVDHAWVEERRLESLTGPVLRSAFALDTTRFPLAVRLPVWAARAVRPKARKLMGVNFSLPREAFVRVNGYDQEPGIRARIDRDLDLRLRRSGYKFYPLLQRAIVYHLYHPERGKIRDQKTLKWWAEQEMSERTRCELGFDSPFDPNV